MNQRGLDYLLALSLSLFISADLMACQCMDYDLQGRYKEADSVVIGTVISGNLTKERVNDDEIMPPIIEVEVEVEEVLKGVVDPIIRVKTWAGGTYGSCGLPVTIGDHFLLFVNGGVVEECSGSSDYHKVRDASRLDELRRFRDDES